MPTIFISYRRADAEGDAGRLHQELRQRLPGVTLFMDVDAIRPGADFIDALEQTTQKSDLALILIGKSWIAQTDSAGQRRLDNPEDFVRREVESALTRKIPVIPVRVQGAEMPSAADLPDALKPLARRQSVELRHSRYTDDITRLVKDISQLLGVTPGDTQAARVTRKRALGRVAAALLTLALAVLVGYALTRSPAAPSTRERFRTVDLSAYANDGIDWVLNEPEGRVSYEGVPFVILGGNRAAVKSAMIGRPTWPIRFSFPIAEAPGVRSVHAIIVGVWADQEQGKIGTLRVTYTEGDDTSVDLINGVTIQESWKTERDLFGGSTPPSVPGAIWRTVYYEEQFRGPDKSFGTLDMLSVATDAERSIAAVELDRTSQRAGFALVALTSER